jgi:hypothetical protein
MKYVEMALAAALTSGQRPVQHRKQLHHAERKARDGGGMARQ